MGRRVIRTYVRPRRVIYSGTVRPPEPKVVLAIFLVVVAITATFFIPIKTAEMRVSNKNWKYTIKEQEDYYVRECHTDTECTPIDDDTELCTDYEHCKNVKHTRTHNTWVTGGVYPVKPFWETNYHIRTGLGYYESRNQDYTVLFVREGASGATHYPNSLKAYNAYGIGDKYTLTLNVWGGVLKTEATQ